ncbi:indolepyruvate oxidoreductase subunit beta family protein [Allosphingosinicella indica]|uniref:Indolepyruvate ferredoxin oxidoreductase beta subunit n=1 Tax=Allosphingosinicella indica TaxID=941907 RepID=A0A1X7G0P7_9SPHN|nr:indolepyruvate oxidoreductase subunit beta family protein [Allosphingosinicella indica]SMF61899.1 indolepyruvate ferredoxin oxidoreductase beta subunit [Allosphingosinicella indica]
MERRRITIAILALGGQGGGVLADWILALAEAKGWRAQGTSVPGVAQRTGSTIYYIELVPDDAAADPVLALMPVPGDVDIVIASELMEAGRAILRGFVTRDQTTLIGSTHRIFAIAEKSAMADGRASSERILAACGERAKRFIGFDMDAEAARAGSVISSIMFGALAGSGALPFARADYEQAIRAGGIAIDANLRGFSAGLAAAKTSEAALPGEAVAPPPRPTTAAGRALADRVTALPQDAQPNALHGAARLTDYQDADYAGLYLDRLTLVAGFGDPLLTTETARHLALWMSYEDTIRVADLKIRASRFARVRDEVRVSDDQVVAVTEFMHPRLREVCETLPAALGRAILHSPRLTRILEPLFRKGRHVETTSLRWFLMLRILAGMRRFRRASLRYAEEQARIEAWLGAIRDAAARDTALATEIARTQGLVKGYGDTFERGLKNFEIVMAAAPALDADAVARLRAAALADDQGTTLAAAIAGGERRAMA